MFTSLQESLLLLNGLAIFMAGALKAFALGAQNKDKDIKFMTGNLILILLCSFMEEWNHFASSEDIEEIKTTLRITSPYLARIRKWEGLPSVRNKLLAHTHRDRPGGKVNWAWDVFAKYDCPTNYAEKVLLGNCAIKAVKVVLSLHQKEYQQAKPKFEQMNRHIERKGIRRITEINSDMEKIDAEVSKIKKELSEDKT